MILSALAWLKVAKEAGAQLPVSLMTRRRYTGWSLALRTGPGLF